MAPSESDEPDVETLLTRVEERAGRARRESLRALVERVGDPDELTGESLRLPEESSRRLEPALSAPDPVVRGYAVTVVTVGIMTTAMVPDGAVLERVLELAGDEDPRVQRAALRPWFWQVASKALGTDGDRPENPVWETANLERLRERAAETFVERLDDEHAVVRKRAARALAPSGYGSGLAHDAELFLHHPAPAAATGTLVEGLADPVDATTAGFLRAESVRTHCRRVLRAVADHRPTLLVSHAEALDAHLDAPVDETRHGAALVLGDLSAEAPETIDRPGRVAGVLGRALSSREDAADVLATLAAARPDASEAAIAELVAGLGHFQDDVRTACAEALVSLRGRVAEAGPVAEALAAADAGENGDREPLAALADEHPGVVVRELSNTGAHPPLDGEGYWDGWGDLFDAVAEVDAELVAPALDALVEDARSGSTHHRAERTLADLAGERPALVAPVVPDLLASLGVEAPVHHQVARTVENAATALERVDGDAVDALVDTLRATERRDRVRAARTLVALWEGDVSVRGGSLPAAVETLAAEHDEDSFPVRPSGIEPAKRATEPLVALVETEPGFVTDRLSEMAAWATGGEEWAAVRPTAHLLAAVAEVEESVVRTALERADGSVEAGSDLDEKRVRAALRESTER